MCGIAVEARFDGQPASVEAVRAMTEAQHTRGPDGAGAWSAGSFALGHRRLSIIDLSAAGAQPMVDEASGVAVVFNGCIYNHHELRRALQSDGITFSSISDTEVVLRAYLRWGEDFVDRLVGMFAIAIADVRNGRL